MNPVGDRKASCIQSKEFGICEGPGISAQVLFFWPGRDIIGLLLSLALP